MKIDLAGASAPSSRDLPPIAALFQIVFDVRAGYTIAWKRAVGGGKSPVGVMSSAGRRMIIDAAHSRTRRSRGIQVVAVRSPHSTRRPYVSTQCLRHSLQPKSPSLSTRSPRLTLQSHYKDISSTTSMQASAPSSTSPLAKKNGMLLCLLLELWSLLATAGLGEAGDMRTA
jgi:hypothetical protein